MTREDKELLLKDICARLPYNVKAYVRNWSNIDRRYYVGVYDVMSVFPSLNEVHVQSSSGSVDVLLEHYDYDIKPYLFPLSSMTEEQEKEYNNLNCYELGCFPHSEEALDYLTKNHFDYRCLIERGLAIDATGLNIY